MEIPEPKRTVRLSHEHYEQLREYAEETAALPHFGNEGIMKKLLSLCGWAVAMLCGLFFFWSLSWDASAFSQPLASTTVAGYSWLASCGVARIGATSLANEDRTVVVDADQYARLKPYLVAKGLSLAEVVNAELKEDLERSDSARMEKGAVEQDAIEASVRWPVLLLFRQ